MGAQGGEQIAFHVVPSGEPVRPAFGDPNRWSRVRRWAEASSVWTQATVPSAAAESGRGRCSAPRKSSGGGGGDAASEPEARGLSARCGGSAATAHGLDPRAEGPRHVAPCR
jgi:hypothetical protein